MEATKTVRSKSHNSISTQACDSLYLLHENLWQFCTQYINTLKNSQVSEWPCTRWRNGWGDDAMHTVQCTILMQWASTLCPGRWGATMQLFAIARKLFSAHQQMCISSRIIAKLLCVYIKLNQIIVYYQFRYKLWIYVSRLYYAARIFIGGMKCDFR